jgi:hypothetical protein
MNDPLVPVTYRIRKSQKEHIKKKVTHDKSQSEIVRQLIEKDMKSKQFIVEAPESFITGNPKDTRIIRRQYVQILHILNPPLIHRFRRYLLNAL